MKLKINRGFIGLTLVLVVTGFLLALISASAINSVLFFDQATRKEYRFMNYYYGQNCIDQAVLSLAHDYFFEVTKPKEIPYFHCTILSIENNGNFRKIYARGDYLKAYVYRSATVQLDKTGIEIINRDN